ncbi:putative glycolipid-binding domain-containing protein [Cribrihabitans neustonicus]|uniref:putative glycolipid-binding domain-containing protein n=1 Tax=Cribrihabitans neustonicus TaxID=1429085 RepID=UPI003B5A8A37
MQKVARWCDWQRQGLEHCVLTGTAEGLTLDGVVAGCDPALFGAYYWVRTDAQFHTREVRLCFTGGRCLHLASDGRGQWQDVTRAAAIPALEGCIDVDIGITPATNTLPVRRLGLAVGASAEILAAFVPPPETGAGEAAPRMTRQRYTRLDETRYRYEGLESGFTAEIEVDAAGMVLDYPGVFRRLG